MKLATLLDGLENFKIYGDANREVKSIGDDSRKIAKRDLFVAIVGEHFDGHEFVDQVIKDGAVAVVGQKMPQRKWLRQATYIKTKDTRLFLSLLASNYYGNPSKKLKMIGVTGTDGKTTTVTMIHHILSVAGKRVGLVSTVEAIIGKQKFDTGLHVTNPEPLILQKFLTQMVKNGCEYAVLEVTSHGLDQNRVAGINFDISVLTNITHEHLDYHKTYNNYLKAKAKLFLNSNVSILNYHDSSFSKIKSLLSQKAKILSYDFKNISGRLRKVILEKFPEKYNQENAAAAVTVVKELGIAEKTIIAAIKKFPGVCGRMEYVKNKKDLNIIIDFAHTPNALQEVLSVLKKQKNKNRKLIAVFGCAGERDKEKRPMMGEISGKLADISIFTAEDPRHENVDEIIAQMLVGARKTSAKEIEKVTTNESIHRYKGHVYLKIPDRKEAIAYAIQKLAEKGDTIAICGKGHERSMCYGNKEYPWSDHEVVQQVLGGKINKIRFMH